MEPIVAGKRLLSTSASGDAPVSFLTFPTDTASDAADYMPLSVQEELIEALETDDQVTVVGVIQVGVLVCSSLVGAENATTLQVATSPTETILAERTSYTFLSG
ncbi:unnamed protein product, partial [Ascophyllum nodosum]